MFEFVVCLLGEETLAAVLQAGVTYWVDRTEVRRMRKRTMFKQGFTRVSDYFLECRDRRVKCDERDTAQSCSSRRQIACHSHRRRATCLEVCRESGT